MKKLLFAALLVAGTFTASAQETQFGVKAGADFASAKGGYSETGFFLGGFASIGISDAFAVQPEVLYVGLPDDAAFLNVPVLAKYTFAEKFSVMAGPGLMYSLNAAEGEDAFKVNIDVASAYQFTENIDASVRYSIGGDKSISGLFVGVGYKF